MRKSTGDLGTNALATGNPLIAMIRLSPSLHSGHEMMRSHHVSGARRDALSRDHLRRVDGALRFKTATFGGEPKTQSYGNFYFYASLSFNTSDYARYNFGRPG